MTSRYHLLVHLCLWRIVSASITAEAFTLFILAAAVLHVVRPPAKPRPVVFTALPLPSLQAAPPPAEDEDRLMTIAWLSNSNSSLNGKIRCSV